MTSINTTPLPVETLDIETLKAQLREALYLNLDDYGLDQQPTGEFSNTFLGMQLNSAFQPVYDSAAGDLIGHEAFLRPSLGSQPIDSQFAFSFAEQSGALVKFDRVCRTLHVLNFRQIYAQKGLLFLNVDTRLLASVNAHGKVFERILHTHAVPPSRVVISIEERVIDHDKQLAEAIENYRERHYQIAITGFGRKQSNLERLWKLSPDFVKLDAGLLYEAERNTGVRRILPRLCAIVRDLGAQPVIEGITTQNQLDIAIESGSTLLQGNLFGRPVNARELKPVRIFPGRKTAA